MNDSIREKIKESLTCGRYPAFNDLVEFWNAVEEDKIDLDLFVSKEDDLQFSSLQEIDEKIELCKNVKDHIIETRNHLSKIRYFLPSKIGFCLIQSNDKLNLAWIYADDWEKNLISKRFNFITG